MTPKKDKNITRSIYLVLLPVLRKHIFVILKNIMKPILQEFIENLEEMFHLIYIEALFIGVILYIVYK